MDEHETALANRRLHQYGPAEMAVFFPERSSSLICFCPIPFYAHESVVNATGVALATLAPDREPGLVARQGDHRVYYPGTGLVGLPMKPIVS